MDRLERQMQIWAGSEPPTLVGGDFNVIPENSDGHKPSSWMYDALFQPEPRERYRAYLGMGYHRRVLLFASRRSGLFYVLGLLPESI